MGYTRCTPARLWLTIRKLPLNKKSRRNGTSKQQIKEDRLKQAIRQFKKQKSIGTVNADKVTPSHGFVLLLGRPAKKAGTYNIVEVLEHVSQPEIEALLVRNGDDG